MNKKFSLNKIRVGILKSIMIIVIFSMISIPLVYADEADSDAIILIFSFNPPELKKINISNTTYDRVIMECLPTTSNNGTPILPLKPINVLLPQKNVVESINVVYESNISLGYGYNVELGTGQNESNKSNFDTSKPYPSELFFYVGTYDFRGYSILTLNLYPIHYIKDTGELYYYEKMTIIIKTCENGSVSPWFRNLVKDETMMKHGVDDYSRINSYTSLPNSTINSSLVDPTESYDYVIVTTDVLKNSNGTHTFQDLADYKNSTGIKTIIITVDDIVNESAYWCSGEWGDGCQFNETFNDTQAKIRNFIRDAYVNWGIQYVLLGGDNESVPARILWAEAFSGGFQFYMPSNLYYACLNGSYNSNVNKMWGEPTDGPDGGDVDLIAEVYIGRACVDNATEVSNFVEKTLAYKTTSDLYLENVSLVGAWIDFPYEKYGGNYKDKFFGPTTHSDAPVGIPSSYTIDKLYDRDWPSFNESDPLTTGWPTSEITGRINNGTHIINHVGHGNYSSWVHNKMKNSDVLALENTKYCFIYSQACDVGAFDNPHDYDCFAEYLTVKTNNGAFAVVMNADKSSGYPKGIGTGSQRFDREFFDAIFGESQSNYRMRELGIAIQDLKEDIRGLIHFPWMRVCYYELNLFGDPQVLLKPAAIPDHDILVAYLEAPDFVIPNATFNVTAMIYNQGSNNESNILVNLTVDGEVEKNITIDSLISNGRAIINFNCSLTYGEHQVGIEVQPVPDEDITDNNYRNKAVIADTPPNKPATPEGETEGEAGKEYTYTSSTTDPDGDKIYYIWDWGDGNTSGWIGPYDSGESCSASYTWSEKGTYLIKVKAKDVYDCESIWSDPLPVDMPISNNIVMSSQSVAVGKSIQFYGSATGGVKPYNWSWDFGDGNYSYEQNPTHNYSELGNYNVTLTVTDNESDSSNTTGIVNVVVLKAEYNISSLGFSKPYDLIYFNDTSDGVYEIVNWSWDFGDGNYSYEQNTSHDYAKDGDYNVTLTVNDSQSNIDVHYQIIHIESIPPIITDVSHSPTVVGYGVNVTVAANVTDGVSGIKIVKVNITYPDNSTGNFTMNHTGSCTYEYIFSDAWQHGQYNYTVWTVDTADNSNFSSVYSFDVSRCFGYTLPGVLSKSVVDRISGSVFTVNENGIANNITVYVRAAYISPPVSFKCMIYRVNDSKLIGTTEEINLSTGVEPKWVVSNFSDPKPILNNDTKYILAFWSNKSCSLYYDYFFEGAQGRYNNKIYSNPPDPTNWSVYEFLLYSIYCSYAPDTEPPEITNVSDTPDTVGFGFNVTISADVVDNASGVNLVSVNITYPDSFSGNYTMNNTVGSTYEYFFTDTWLIGQYNYSIWTMDNAYNTDNSTGHSFNVSAQATVSVCTIKDEYNNNETVNLTDPPPASNLIGYELLDDNQVLHIWNRFDSYYFNISNGLQFTNHYDGYWSHNVLMLGYYKNDEWNLIYRTDELSGFHKEIDSDNEPYVNATLWKDLTYKGYDFRLAIRYHLGVDDNELTVIPYIKNIDDEDIPYVLGFGWEMKDIQIDITPGGDYIEVNQTMYYLNQTLDNVYTDLIKPEFYLRENTTGTSTKSLYLKWNESLTYKLQVKSRAGQYNAPVTLFVRIGTLDSGQEKQTKMYWYDADQATFYFNNYSTGEAWATNPSYMVDGNPSNTASATVDGDIELCNGNNCSGSDIGTVSKVELRVSAYYTDDPRDTILRPVFSGTTDGVNYPYQTPPGAGPVWSPWFDITDDPFAPQSWSWTDVQNLDCDVESGYGMLGFTLYCSKVEIRVTYTPYTPPEISNPYPSNGSIGVSLTPMLNITVSDDNGDSMNISWLSNSSGSWQVFGMNNSVGNNGTYHQTMSNASVNGQWWYWKVNVSDGTNYTESSVYKFYTGYESKIENTGSTHFKGYLLIQVQFYDTTNSTWVVAADTVNESSPRSVLWKDPAGEPGQHLLALDTIFNGNVNTTDLIDSFGSGTYRVYAAFRNPDGTVLVCDDESLMEDSYEFTVSES